MANLDILLHMVGSRGSSTRVRVGTSGTTLRPFLKQRHKGSMETVWFATIWHIWLLRDQLIFTGKPKEQNSVVDLIKFQTLQWLQANLWHNYPKIGGMYRKFMLATWQ
ncbi:hypothetical protein SLA2020_113360 [Shorea laevis]